MRKRRPLSWALIVDVLRLNDFGIIAATGIAAYFIYVHPLRSFDLAPRFLIVSVIGALVASAIFQVAGVYSVKPNEWKSLRINRLVAGWLTACAMMLASAFALKVSDDFSRVWTYSWFLVAGGLLVLARLFVLQWVSRAARDRRFAQRTVIVGMGDQGASLLGYLNRHRDLVTEIVGFIDDRRDRAPGQINGLPRLGDTEDLLRLIREDEVDQVIVALPWSAARRVAELVEQVATTPVAIRLAPDLVGLTYPNVPYTHVASVPMLSVSDRPLDHRSEIVKTVEDYVLASLLTVFLAPLLLVIAIAIKVDSRGPVLFKQRRYGFNNKLIEVLKFRTMFVDTTDADCERQTTRDDPRVTRVGRFLRRTSLDELPQIFNVLQGKMSLVGPRPHAVATKAAGVLFEEAVGRYGARHRVKPGITGWAQVNGYRGETDTIEKIERRVEHDLFYIENWSLWLDLVILVRTVGILLSDERAY